MFSSFPLTRDLVLVGGGHTHALILRKWGMTPLAGVRLTVINPGPTAPYSGMLPGHLAGHYSRDALDIDLVKLARFAGARVILGSANEIDTVAKAIHVPGRPPIHYDIASIDVGITSEMPTLPGFAANAVPAKPLGTFARRWAEFRQRSGPASIAVIGGGVAGVEIAMALSHAMQHDGRSARVTLIDRGEILKGLRKQTEGKLRGALAAQQVTVLENAEIAEIAEGGILLSDGSTIEADFVTGAAGARPHDWIARSKLDLKQGFICVNEYLQSSDPSLFAVGDCAHMTADPRPKAGVYAVRQAPVLFDNLRAALKEKGRLRPYRPQKDYLKLISLGEKSALADRFGVTLSGPVMWRWKNHIDVQFMDQFQTLPEMPSVQLPKEHAADLFETLGPKPMCGGCGSKVGRGALSRALSALPRSTRPDILSVDGDDAGILKTAEGFQTLSTDHLRAMSDDPVMMTRIAAIHALGDVWAMGTQPQAVTANIILPRMSEALAERSLKEIMTTAQEVMTDAGAAIVGGHSTQGQELTVGFTVTGLSKAAPITLVGAQPGDHLFLTKPLGSGVIMAAEMARAASGDWVAEALVRMVQSQAEASKILSAANAMTDVTGFGLVGHLLNICEASGVGATLWLDEIPLMRGALELSEIGIRSTLYPDNKSALPQITSTPKTDLLFDPQTAGGLLAAVSGDAQAVLHKLTEAGYQAAIIGRITDAPGQISIS